MKKNRVITLIVAVAVIVVGAFIYMRGAQAPAGQGVATGVKFSDSKYAPYAHLISADNAYDAATQKALTGFQVDKKVLPDGSLRITLNAQESGYKTQTYAVQPSQSLYFVERSAGDDSGNTDRFLGDDNAILVDANGNIVQ